MQHLHAAIMNQEAARYALDDATRKARTQWEKYKSDYAAPGETWTSWSVQNQPQLHAMASNYNMAVNATDMETMYAYGGSAGPYIQHKQGIRTAVDTPQTFPG